MNLPKIPTRFTSLSRTLSALGLTAALGLAGCGGGGGEPDLPGLTGTGETPPVAGAPEAPPNPDLGSNSLGDALKDLGVNLDEGQRLDADGNPLPDTYGPFGPKWQYSKKTEIFMAGLAPYGHHGSGTLLEDASESAHLVPGDGHLPGSLGRVTDAEAPWMNPGIAAGSSDKARLLERSRRAMVAADVDGDGLEEIVGVYIDDDMLKVWVREDQQDGGATSEAILATGVNARSVALGAIDIDGSGRQVLVIGAEQASAMQVLFAEQADGVWALRDELARQLSLSGNGTPVLEIAAGNLDYDAPQELALVLNEIQVGNDGREILGARWWAFDRNAEGLTTLVDGEAVTGMSFQGAQEKLDHAGTPETAVLADVAIGDFDGDSLGEIALGGLRIAREKRSSAFEYVLILRDDLLKKLAPMGAQRAQDYLNNDWVTNYNRGYRYVRVNALNVDGAGADEIQIDSRIYAYGYRSDSPQERDESRYFEVRGRLPSRLFFDPNAGVLHITQLNSDIAVGDVSGDGREDVMVLHQDADQVEFFGMFIDTSRGGTQASFQSFGRIPLDQRYNRAAPGSLRDPILLLPDVDQDSTVLRYEVSSGHKLTFTQPIVHTVIAAPPSNDDPEAKQSIEANTTEFGRTSTNTSGTDRGVSVSASAWVGAKVEIGIGMAKLEAEFTHKLSSDLSKVVSKTYEVSRTVTIRTGIDDKRQLHDVVIFTSIPVDLYEYTVLSHSDPALIGRKIQVALPRDPITLDTTLDFYNGVVEPSMRIGKDVLPHTIGKWRTYANAAMKNAAVEHHGGVASLKIESVGQGPGSKTVSIDVARYHEKSQSLTKGYEFSSQVTVGGAIAGMSIGGGTTNGVRVSSGEGMTVTGTVGNMQIPAEDAALLLKHSFDWGIYTYSHQHAGTGQTFQVVNYWVTPRKP